MDEDLKLIKQVLNGNIDSFNIIVNKYEMMLLRYIYNMLNNKEAAEDITQEVLITIYNKLYLYNHQYKFSNWILQIAKNKTIDYMRKYRRVYEASIDDIKEVQSKDMSPEETAEYKDTIISIKGFINSLNSVDKQIIILRYAQQRTFEDIGEILNISTSAVKRRYYKIRDKYKSCSNLGEERYRI